MIAFIKNIYSIPINFLIVGLLNTIFGYVVGILNLFFLKDIIGVLYIGILNNFLSITFAFILLKNFVFKTKNSNWFYEYLRSFLVYGLIAIIGILILWICIEILELNIYLSQGITIFSTLFISYSRHKNFTFKT